MNDLSQALQDLPLAALTPVFLLVLVGLMLWAAGRRLLRVAFAAGGFVVGGLAGWLMAEAMGLEMPWLVALIGGAVMAVLGALLYRMTMAVATAVILALAAPLAVISVADASPNMRVFSPPDEVEHTQTPPAREPDELDRWMQERLRNIEESARDEIRRRFPEADLDNFKLPQGVAAEDVHDALAEHLGVPPEVAAQYERLKGYAMRVWEGIRRTWANVRPDLRPYLVGSAIMGGLLGLFIGVLAPGITASIVTAFGGSLLWLGGLRVIGEHFGLTEAGWLPARGAVWMAVWIVVALLGLAIQWRLRPKRADNP
jgi:hypothetical protein